MAAAKPIVASAAGSVSELVAHDETGFIGPPRDDTARARGIVTLLKEDGLRQRMSAAGRARAADRFSIERMTQDIQAVYARALRS